MTIPNDGLFLTGNHLTKKDTTPLNVGPIIIHPKRAEAVKEKKRLTPILEKRFPLSCFRIHVQEVQYVEKAAQAAGNDAPEESK